MVGSSGHKGISRIDSAKNNTHGWYVRVQYRGETHAKFFSDSAHGGQKKALAKAVRHRNDIEKELGKPRTDRTITVGSARNNSGVQGIKRINKGNGHAYEVTWSPVPGVIQRTTVSIKKFGENEAFRRAIRIRQQKERLYFGGLITQNWPTTPPPFDDAVDGISSATTKPVTLKKIKMPKAATSSTVTDTTRSQASAKKTSRKDVGQSKPFNKVASAKSSSNSDNKTKAVKPKNAETKVAKAAPSGRAVTQNPEAVSSEVKSRPNKTNLATKRKAKS
jgi:hypothetical protein